MIYDDYSLNLHWHALNYRTASSQDAQRAWVELEACVSRIAETHAAAERERIADWLASQRNDVPATGQEFAQALRSQENRPLTSPLDGGDKS
jgi:hypothetical protein